MEELTYRWGSNQNYTKYHTANHHMYLKSRLVKQTALNLHARFQATFKSLNHMQSMREEKYILNKKNTP